MNGPPRNKAKISHNSADAGRSDNSPKCLTRQPHITSTWYVEAPAEDGDESISVEAVGKAIQIRRLRYEFFDESLFADPAWDMLLDLYQAEIAQQRVTVSSLCEAAAVPTTTALRWITTMTNANLFCRYSDRSDARRIFVRLSPTAKAAMHRYFRKIDELAQLPD